MSIGDNAYASPAETFPKGEAEARKAIALDDRLADAHAVLGAILFRYRWDWKGAKTELLRAVELDSTATRALIAYGEYLRTIGEFEEAIAIRKKAVM